MTRDQLKAQLTGLINRRDFTGTALVDTFLDQALTRVQRDLRVPAMEKTLNVTWNAGDTSLSIPTDLLELKYIIPASLKRRLRKVDIDTALAYSQASDTPLVYCRDGAEWLVGPIPSAGDILRVQYYADYPALVNGSDTNIIATIAWDLITYGAAVPAADYFKDARADSYEQRYQFILGKLQDQADTDELGDDAAVSPAYSYPDEDCD